jgi:hypothetical protein
MATYWHNRYRQTLAQMQSAQSAETRAAYMDLAEHYLSMRRFSQGPATGDKFRSAA